MIKKSVGVLGGGQLGRMMAEAGHRLGIRLVVLDSGNNPCNFIVEPSYPVK
jgi:phosphoribosylaminoimidazole carboxylase